MEKKVINRKDVLISMAKRGYTLVRENPDMTVLQFADIKDESVVNRLSVTVYLYNDTYSIISVIAPGIIKLSVEAIDNILDNNKFSKLEKHIKSTLTKIYS